MQGMSQTVITEKPWVARHPYITAALALVVAFVVLAVVSIQQTNAARAEAGEVCREEVRSRYHDPTQEVLISVSYIGTPKAIEHRAFDSQGRFTWTCLSTKTDDGWSVDVWK